MIEKIYFILLLLLILLVILLKNKVIREGFTISDLETRLQALESNGVLTTSSYGIQNARGWFDVDEKKDNAVRASYTGTSPGNNDMRFKFQQY